MTRRPAVLGVAAAVLAVAAFGNVAVFRAQEDELAAPHRAAVQNHSDRLLALTEAHGRNVGSRFTVYAWLGDAAPGSTVVLAPGHPLVVEGLVGLGRADVVYGDHEGLVDDDTAGDLRAAATVVDWFARGRFARESSLEDTGEPAAFREGDFAAVLGDRDEQERRFLVHWSDDIVVLVDEDVAGDHGLPGDGG